MVLSKEENKLPDLFPSVNLAECLKNKTVPRNCEKIVRRFSKPGIILRKQSICQLGLICRSFPFLTR